MSLSHWRCSGTGPAPRSAMTAAGPFLVEMRILPSRRAFCLREQRLELHSRVRSARLGAGGSRRGLRPTRGAPPGDPRRHRLSESVAKARIPPKHRKRIVDIPRFFSRPIPARSAFATDSDTPPPPDRPRSPARATTTIPAGPGNFLVRRAHCAASGREECGTRGEKHALAAFFNRRTARPPVRPRPLRPFPSATPFHPPLHEKKKRSGG